MIGGAIVALTSAAQGKSNEDVGRDVLMAASGGDLVKDALDVVVEPMGKIYFCNLAGIKESEVIGDQDLDGDGIVGPDMTADEDANEELGEEFDEEEIEDE